MACTFDGHNLVAVADVQTVCFMYSCMTKTRAYIHAHAAFCLYTAGQAAVQPAHGPVHQCIGFDGDLFAVFGTCPFVSLAVLPKEWSSCAALCCMTTCWLV